MYVDLSDSKVLVFGAGKIATRRISVLNEFCSDITVIADNFSCEAKDLGKNEKIKTVCRKYAEGDCDGFDIVIAATDNRKVNHSIFEECREKHISVNVCDCKEECSFYFPSIISDENVVVGVTASGYDHKRTKYVADNIRKLKSDIF